MFRTLLISICIICSAVSADTPVYEDFKLLASDGASEDQFGNSVSISNDGTSVIVGTAQWCCSNTGAAYIYEHIDGAWQETKLLASDGASGDYFGQSVSISGDGTTAIVGAYSNDSNADASGSAYIYKLVKGVWQETKLLASDGASGDYFGNSVSISNDGTSVIVGAYYDDDNSGFGSAYIYRFNGSSWIETKLVASDGASDDYFGHSVSISSDGTTAIVGSYNDDDHGTGSGSAYIYRFNGSSWIETKLLASDGEAEDKFGWSVAASGDTVIVGAYWNTDNWSTSGSAYIYELVGGVWQETILLASDGEGFPGFGHSVSIASDGTSVIVGSYNHLEEGTAYIYNFDGTNWVEETILLASDGAYGDRFGFGVSISGDATTAIVGAYYDDDNGDNSGSAYVYELVESDSDGDGVPDNIDNCYLYNPDQADCNENGIGDICDVADSTSFDCDQNNVPDECQPDCDGDGWIDACDSEGDCDDDGIPDNCEADCNGNSIPDDCDIIYGISEDCNENGIPDECDIADGTEEDCNGNDIPDSCDITDGTEEDCNENDVPDTCEFEESFQETTILIASDGDYSFGNSVSISSDGTTAIVGANGKASGNYGSAYIYSLVKGVWEETKLLPSDGGYGNFGYSVSISSNGTTAIVGAFEDNSNGLYSGSAYIFELVKGVWQETKLMASDGAGGDRFGNSVSISGAVT